MQQQLDTDAKITALDAKVDDFVTQQLTWADAEIAALLAQVGALGLQLTWYEDGDGDGFGNPVSDADSER